MCHRYMQCAYIAQNYREVISLVIQPPGLTFHLRRGGGGGQGKLPPLKGPNSPQDYNYMNCSYL